MDSQGNNTIKSSMKVNLKKKKLSKKRKHISTSSDSSSSDSNTNIKYKKSKNRVTSRPKQKIHSTKHKHGKTKNRSSSSDSSSSVDSSTSSTDSSSSSSTSEDERKRRKKQKNKLKKLQKRKKVKKHSNPPEIEEAADVPSSDIPLKLMNEGRSMAPMTKEQWEKKQSIVRRVYDDSTGRSRLIKGDGEVIEEIVSKERHNQINQQATKGDGDYFQKKLKQL